jgi:hypothetical protein
MNAPAQKVRIVLEHDGGELQTFETDSRDPTDRHGYEREAARPNARA